MSLVIVASGERWTLYHFLLSCHISSNQGEAEAFHLTFRLSLDHSVAEVWSSLFSREDITHHALLRDLFLKYIIWFLWLTKKKKKLTLTITFRTFSVLKTDFQWLWQFLWVKQLRIGSKFCAFLAPYLVNWRKEGISEGNFFFVITTCFPHLWWWLWKKQWKKSPSFQKIGKLFFKSFWKEPIWSHHTFTRSLWRLVP